METMKEMKKVIRQAKAACCLLLFLLCCHAAVAQTDGWEERDERQVDIDRASLAGDCMDYCRTLLFANDDCYSEVLSMLTYESVTRDSSTYARFAKAASTFSKKQHRILLKAFYQHLIFEYVAEEEPPTQAGFHALFPFIPQRDYSIVSQCWDEFFSP